MTEPVVSGSMILRDGRCLAYHCYGDPAGRPVHFFHGFPGSRRQAALLHRAAHAWGMYLISADRPGYGGSSPLAQRTILGFADDVGQLADLLNHRKFDVLGVSCGGPYALGAAQAMPDRVRRIVLMAGIGPMNQPVLRKGQLPILRLLFALSRLHPCLPRPLLAMDRKMFMTDPQKALRKLSSLLPKADRHVLAGSAEVAKVFAESLAQAYAPGVSGALLDAALIAQDHGVSLKSITQPTLILQSGQDRNVPPAMGRYMAEKIPKAHLEMCPDEGHLSIVVNKADHAMKWLNTAVTGKTSL